ncbi:hypothetical protein E5Q_03946 [Mixia osmundae IAM 14324]|uniref:FAD-binding FR-type domain-containing protein n=1 Tax=Mixia osmundae (strain CBS 9802 / IAM 14324 / JCM 22182 / KY 12970) TaxID=764103 RepID=G7E388_MIXOS|nr:hypothetical protein E5Q_03946 [Mixia osmundae IAM 14324]
MSGLGADGLPIGYKNEIYDSYVTDPYFARILTWTWLSLFLGASALTLARHLPRYSFAMGKRWQPPWLWSDLAIPAHSSSYEPIRCDVSEAAQPQPPARLRLLCALYGKTVHRPAKPYFARLTAGQICVLALIPALVLATLLPQQELLQNPNRLGFIALALLPPLFLFASKNSFCALLLGQSYETVNYIHRWLGRTVTVLILTHGGIWLNQYRQAGNLSQMMTATPKIPYGLAALAFLLLLVLSSLPVIRQKAHQIFFALHIVGIVGFVTMVSYHTSYSRPWIAWGVVFLYGLDLALRAFRARLSRVSVQALGRSPQHAMTRLVVKDLQGGWRAGQHVNITLLHSLPTELTTFFRSATRSLESHPFTIACAPPEISVLSAPASGGFPLYVRSNGSKSWTGELHTFASLRKPAVIKALIDGPYGGLGFAQPSSKEHVVLIAGGSGMSFVLACLDEIVGQRVRSLNDARTRRIDLFWIIKHQEHLAWFSKSIEEIAAAAQASGSVDFVPHFYVTAGTTADASESSVMSGRPDVAALIENSIERAINPCSICTVCKCDCLPLNRGCCPADEEACTSPARPKVPAEKSCCNDDPPKRKCSPRSDGVKPVAAPRPLIRGGAAIIVCGPASLQRSVHQSVASLSLSTYRRIGGISLHTESFHS